MWKLRLSDALSFDDSTAPERTQVRRRWMVALLLLGAAVLLVLTLLVPGRTYSAQHSWDLMVWVDGAHRMAAGLLPNRDFHTPFGLLGYLLLGWAYELSSGLGEIMPVNTALFTLLLMPLLIYTCVSRLPWFVALVFGLHIIILTVAPFNIGDLGAAPTFAMFYNRWGWALVSLLSIYVLPRYPASGGDTADALAMAALWLIMFYLKVSYAAVGGALLLGLLAFSHMRRPAIGAMIASALLLVVVELFWAHTLSYIMDLGAAGAVIGGIQGGMRQLASGLFINISGLFLFAAVGFLRWFAESASTISSWGWALARRASSWRTKTLKGPAF